MVECFAGFCMILIGGAGMAGLAMLARLKPTDVWHAVGVVIGASLYMCVAELFVIIGVQSIFGDRPWVQRLMKRSFMVLALWMLICSATIVVAVALIVW